MNTIFENNKHNKDGPDEIICPDINNASEKNNVEEKNEKKAFIAWPDDKPSAATENVSVEIIEGRTKKGGYVAYPKEPVKE